MPVRTDVEIGVFICVSTLSQLECVYAQGSAREMKSTKAVRQRERERDAYISRKKKCVKWKESVIRGGRQIPLSLDMMRCRGSRLCFQSVWCLCHGPPASISFHSVSLHSQPAEGEPCCSEHQQEAQQEVGNTWMAHRPCYRMTFMRFL